ncbi:MAG: MBL fold metallo-hydrolase [Gammaproteobacteria bacterium]|nr:MBL fold metallo-hydrolase [Gammaproteobacteria bacterium]
MKPSFLLGGLVLAATTALAVLGAQAEPAARPGPASFNFGNAGAIEKIADNVYLIGGGGGNTTVFISSRGVVLVDSKAPGQAQAIMDQVKTVTDKPVIYLINTHSHFDHTSGNAWFPDSVKIVAHENLANQLKADPAFQSEAGKRGLVDITYTDRLTLLEGDDAVDLYNFGPAHTSGDSLVVFRKAGVMAAGDVFPGKTQPLIDTRNGGSGLNYGAFVDAAVRSIRNVRVVVPGHSPLATWQDFVDFGEFNRLMLKHARASLKAGRTSEEALKSFRIPAKFAGYKLGPTFVQPHPAGNFETMYQELQAR